MVIRTTRRNLGALGMALPLAGLFGGVSGGAAAPARTTSSLGGFNLYRTHISPFNLGDGRSASIPCLADIGTIEVPADHHGKSDAKGIDGKFILRFARFPARQKMARAPVFLFGGGPSWENDLYAFYEQGEQGSTDWMFIELITQTNDLVLIDHRGNMGCIAPKLPPQSMPSAMPLDRYLDFDERRQHAIAANASLHERWLNADIDLALFNTSQLVHDVDRIRTALGYDKIILMGESNGTYRCRDYLRRFPQNVDKAMLASAHAYRKKPDPDDVATVLDRVNLAMRADPVVGRRAPALKTLYNDAEQALSRHPQVEIGSADAPATGITLGPEDLVGYFWSYFGSNSRVRKGPGELWKITNGDFKNLANFTYDSRRQIQSASDVAFGGAAMPIDPHPDRAKARGFNCLDRTGDDGDSAAWAYHHDDQTSFTHDVPILYLTGDWDIRTPIEAVRRLAEPTARIVSIENQSHWFPVPLQRNWRTDETAVADAVLQNVKSFLDGTDPSPIPAWTSRFDPTAFPG